MIFFFNECGDATLLPEVLITIGTVILTFIEPAQLLIKYANLGLFKPGTHGIHFVQQHSNYLSTDIFGVINTLLNGDVR